MHLKIFAITFLLLPAIPLAGQTAANPAAKNENAEERCVISGMVTRKADGGPLKGATVQLTNREDRDHTIATKTDAGGHFELRNVPAGQGRDSAGMDGDTKTMDLNLIQTKEK